MCGCSPPPRAGRGKGDQKSLNLGHRGLILELQVTLPALAWIHAPAAPGSSCLSRRASSRQRALGCAASFLEEPERQQHHLEKGTKPVPSQLLGRSRATPHKPQ